MLPRIPTLLCAISPEDRQNRKKPTYPHDPQPTNYIRQVSSEIKVALGGHLATVTRVSSTGGSSLRGSGTNSVSAGALVLEAEGMVPSQPGLFFQGDNAINGGLGTPFGDGMRCAGGAVIRLEVIFGAADGTGATSIDIASKGGVIVGDVKRCQLWYRDPNSTPCGAGFNLSNGLEIPWSA